MNCPHCQRPIPDASVVKAAASINARKNAGKGARPGANGLVRNGCAHGAVCSPANGYDFCMDCQKRVRWDAKAERWRIVYRTKPAP